MSSSKCNRPDLEPLLSDYYTGHLSDDDEQKVRAHLKVCRSCRHSLRVMDQIAGKEPIQLADPDEMHFSPQLLGRYYSDPGSLDAALIDRISTHLEHCPQCAADVEFLQSSHHDFSLWADARPHRRSLWRRILNAVKRALPKHRRH